MSSLALGLKEAATVLLLWSLAAGLMVLLGTLVDRLARRRSASERHVIWLATTAMVLLLPVSWFVLPGVLPQAGSMPIDDDSALANRPYETWSPPPPVQPSRADPAGLPEWPSDKLQQAVQPIAVAAERAKRADLSIVSRPPASDLSMLWGSGALIGVWLLGMSIVAVRYVFERQRLEREFRDCQRAPPATLVAFAGRLAREDGLHVVLPGSSVPLRAAANAVQIFVSKRDVGPLICGSFPARLLLPWSLAAQSIEAQEAAIRHELAHVVRRDEWTRQLLLVLRLLFWFHPLVRFSCQQVQLYAEHACDDRVLLRGCRADTYSDLLLCVGRAQNHVALTTAATSGMAQSQIAKRIVAIVRPNARRGHVSAGRALTITSAAFGLMLSVAMLRPSDARTGARQAADTLPVRENSPSAAGRTLSFPDDRIVGTLKIRPARDRTMMEDLSQRWTPHGQATGQVAIPPDHEVTLWVSADGAKDLSFLSTLPQDSLYGLNLRRSRAEDSQAKFIAKLTGLKHLRLEDTRLSPQGIRELSSLSNLVLFDYDAFGINRQPIADVAPGESTLDGRQPSAAPTYGVDDEAAKVFLSMPRLRFLGLRLNPITSRALLSISRLPELEILQLTETRVSDKGLELLKNLKQLRSLSFGVYDRGAPISDAGAAKLAGLSNLKRLSLNGTLITKEGLAQVAKLPKLEELSVEGVELAPEDFSVLQTARSLRKISADWNHRRWRAYGRTLAEIRTLEEIGQNLPVDREGLQRLLQLPNLRKLSVSGHGGDEDYSGLGKELAQCKKLESLSLQGISIGDEGVLALSELKQLTHVALYLTAVKGPGLKGLAGLPKLDWLSLSCGEELDLWQLPDLPNLRAINLTTSTLPTDVRWYRKLRTLKSAQIFSLVGDREMAGIAQWKSLEGLTLENGALSDAGLQHVRELKQLTYVSVGGALTPAGLSTLGDMPNLQSMWVVSPYFGKEDVTALEKKLGAVSVKVQGGDRCLFPGLKDGILRSSSKQRLVLDALEGNPAPPLEIERWFPPAKAPATWEPIALDAYRGQVVLINFWTNRRSSCVRAILELKRLRKAYRNQGFEVLGIHQTRGGDTLAQFLRAFPLPWPVGLDREDGTAQALSNSQFPSYYLVDRRGILRMALVAPNDLESAIELLLSE